MPSHHTPLHRAAALAFAKASETQPEDHKVESPPKPEMGDLAIGCFALAKARKQSPADVAKAIAAAFEPSELLASAQAAGPFVNFRVNRPAVLRWIVDAALTSSLLPRTHGAGKTICIDYGSPNISKHLAYHHIRGTTLGHALAQSHRALGYKVVGINFLGDWGTTHGMVLAAYADQRGETPGVDELASLAISVDELNAFYASFRKKYEGTNTAEDRGRAWLKRLEDGDPWATALWQRFRAVSWAEFEEVYRILGIKYDDLNGESHFWKSAETEIAELRDKGLLTESEGAQVVEIEGDKTPFIVLTKDGTTLYSTRDLAAADYRWNTYHFDRSLYVVDRGQTHHFRQLFKVLGKLGRDWSVRCEHVPYGLVRVDGKKTTTRWGNVVLMEQVFAIAEEEVRAKIAQVNPDLAADIVDVVARQVGIGAVIFANLAPQRDKDIDFDIDKAVALDGDSGPYLQIQHARCASIARKAGERVTSVDGVDFSKLSHDAEWAVAKKLLDYPEIVVRATANAEPHIICHYLLELCGGFSRWYTLGNGDASLRVLVDDPAVRRARLALVAGVQATLREGLSLLGIAAPDQM
jgi:arginyl-tRNA synthetase